MQVLSRWSRDERGVTAIETALILPVLLFGVMMLFELARIALMIGIGNLSLEHALQDFRRDANYYSKNAEELQQDIEDRMIDFSYGFLTEENLEIEVLPFDNLYQFGQGTNETADEEEREASQNDRSPPILSVTVDLSQRFMTPLPALFGLGDAFQYQYRHLLGDLPSSAEEEDE
ncbi:pilus assembly protein [Pseudomonas sp. ABC1]|uniref:TadE/TadG family type IV pilus assembly protein n=1 Tax=Pseudomonas sp. ABC1 TaxID=2748080 RepID=UPI0015C30AFA|nr:TadE/TadG family type IV pilus assembly protein [Pseudomonas sp. ABC1]QLF92014.1 pilus assembly protein [Pseudomonas sp. ABC1]